VAIKTLKLDLGERGYEIHIGPGLLTRAADLIPLDVTGKSVFILADQNVSEYIDTLRKSLSDKAGHIEVLDIEGGEGAKTYEGLQKVLSWLLTNKVDRQSVFIALGGGVIGDVGGFAASVVLRGIPYVQIPTTLLAQVDSSVGGKTGINTPEGKNLVGSFYQPLTVICDTDVLKSLPEREMRAGYAETVKYGLIDNAEFFGWLEESGPGILALKGEVLRPAIEISCQSKANIVAQDERESGARALLNLGHTFAHALELAAGYDGSLLHGEAVGIGMVLAFKLSCKMGLCPEEDVQRVQTHLSSVELKTSVAETGIKASAQELVAMMQGDKKASGGKIGFILVRGIGQAFQSRDVNLEDVRAVIQDSIEGK